MSKIWFGVITEQLAASKQFYQTYFGCELVYESDWFVLLQLGDSELGFLRPGLPEQAAPFRAAYPGQGMWIVVEVDDARAEYERLQGLGLNMAQELRDEPWGDRHFVLLDPNGIGVDVVQRLA